VRPAVIKGAEAAINLSPGPGRGVETNITEIRGLLASMGENTIQVVNPPESQEYIARFPVLNTSDETQFQATTQAAMLKALETKFQPGQIIIKSTEFVGARMAQSLASQTIWLVLIALVLILVYMIIRFHPWIYGAAAVLGIMHDALVMLAFDAVFRIEIDAGTIAAILTILGYSINDTIVNFDRARENITLMRGDNLRNILDTSVTQTLSRTFITSGATLLTVIALVILTTGSIQNFAKNMTVGIIEGTYSTFISAFIVIQWNAWAQKRRKGRDLARYGIVASSAPERETAGARGGVDDGAPVVEPDQVPGAFASEPELEAGTPAIGVAVDGNNGPGQPGTPGSVGQGAAPGVAHATGVQAGGAQDPQKAPGPQPNVLTFPGSTGSRKHKKHRRRHH
jgi:preprotein translocase subunit SecF